MKTVVEYVSDYAMISPDKVAVIVEREKFTYHDLFDKVCRYSYFLKKGGVVKGDIVVVKASQSFDYVVLYLAVHFAGGIVASMEKNLPETEMVNIASKLKANVIISENNYSDIFSAKYFNRNTVLQDADEMDMESFVPRFPNLDDPADILFTTGTTGTSKGVQLSHRALTATAENLIYGCEYKKDTIIIVPGPLNHANAIRKLFTTFVNGSTIVILNGMTNLTEFYYALDHAEGKIACCLPPSAIRLLFMRTKDRLGDYADRIDFIESATSPLPEPDKLKLCEMLPNTRLYNNYGSSESASVCMYDYNKYPGKASCIGKSMPNSKVIIVDDDKKEIQSSKDNMGYIACIGAVNMMGYVNDPTLTREVLVDGIVYTNDIGYIDEDGFIYVIGRKGDVINVGGFKVAPAEVESVALEYDSVDDCICIPVDNEVTGKAIKLLVVCHDAEFNSKRLLKFMRKKLESYKIPRYVEKADKIAHTYNGKLDRKAYLV